jgi:AraC-like DNA-binding protein
VQLKPNSLSVTYQWLEATAVPPTSLVAMELAFIVRLARLATREQIRPLKVLSPVSLLPVAASTRFFGIQVQRGKDPSVTFSKVDAERPFLTANESMWRVFEPELRRRLADLDESAAVADRVRSALLESLPSGQTSMESIAGKLAMSKRTLQRRLNEEDASFQGVLNGTREALARHYLTKTSITCAEISFLLGFEDPNSFFRAFHDWTGDSPERMRQAIAN